MKVQHQKRIQWFVITLVFSFLFNSVNANNGEKLFRQNCTACHKIEGDLVGPRLKGVKAKWEAAGELENLLLWVKDPRGLYESNTSEMARTAWDIKPTTMIGFASLTDEQIMQIFEHIEAEVIPPPPPFPPEKRGKHTQEELMRMKAEQQSQNRIVFILLILSAFGMTLGISSVSKAIEVFCWASKGEEPPQKKKNKRGIIIVLLLSFFVPLRTFSLTIYKASMSEDWLVVPQTYNVVLLIINLFLLMVLYNQYKVLKSLVKHSVNVKNH